MNINGIPATAASSSTATLASKAIQISLAAMLGVVVIGTVGFSHISAVHNATHDVRHATAFPCH
ncbi:CbtB domain-containing protein [Bosea beijingensis]